MASNFLAVTPVLPSADLSRDVPWYQQNLGFQLVFADDMYAVLKRDHLFIHLQWHADTPDDPLLGGSVIRIFVKDIQPIFEEMVERGAVAKNALRLQTAWGTNEFGLYDLNKNALFFVADVNT